MMMTGQTNDGSNNTHANTFKNLSEDEHQVTINHTLGKIHRKIANIQRQFVSQSKKQSKEEASASLKLFNKLFGELMRVTTRCISEESSIYDQLIITCLSLLSIGLFKGGKSHLFKNAKIKGQLLNVIINCDIERLIQKNSKAQTSLVYLMDLMRPYVP